MEKLFTLALLVLSLIVCGISLNYGFGTLEKPGPGLYPFFIGLYISFFSGWLLFLRKKSKIAGPFFSKDSITILFLMVTIFVSWIVVMPHLGYVIVTLTATFCFSKVLRLEGWIKPLLLSVGTALFVYVLFDYWLYIDLPRGILE
jgi:hypothetical protein